MKKTLTYRKLKLIQQLMVAEKRFLSGPGGPVFLVTQAGYLIDKYGIVLDQVQYAGSAYELEWNALYKTVNRVVNGMELIVKPEKIPVHGMRYIRFKGYTGWVPAISRKAECDHIARMEDLAEYVLAELPLLAHIEVMLKEIR